jgi:hypothetical protein
MACVPTGPWSHVRSLSDAADYLALEIDELSIWASDKLYDDPADAPCEQANEGAQQRLLVNQAAQTLWIKHSDKETLDRQYKATVSERTPTGGVGIGRNRRNNPTQSKLHCLVAIGCAIYLTCLQVPSSRVIRLKSLDAVQWLLPCSVRV